MSLDKVLIPDGKGGIMSHPALQYDFQTLLNGLQIEVEKGYINRIDHNGLSLFNYRPSCQFDNAWNEFSLLARGLILHIPSQQIVALPFPKFFNYGEQGYDIPELPFIVSEKMDGSLGILYFWKSSWHIATRGSFTSEQAQWAEKWLHQNIKTNHLSEKETYLVEIIAKTNRIVINYDFEGLVLLAIYRNDTGGEHGVESLDIIAELAGFQRPNVYHYSFEELLSLAKTLSVNQEGFVVRFQNGLRLKIKGDEYCRVHRIISSVTPLGVWSSMVACDNLQAIQEQLPEEYHQDYKTIITFLQKEHDTLVSILKQDQEQASGLSDKELGLSLKRFHPISQKFLFRVRKQGFLEKIQSPGNDRERFFKTFRPTGNILEGYEPTGAVNRFAREQNS